MGHQSRGRVLRRCARHQPEIQSERSGQHAAGHHFHQCGLQARGRHGVVGRHGQKSTQRRAQLEGRAVGPRRPAKRARIPTRALRPRPKTARASRLSGKPPRACRCRPSFSAAAAPRPRRWSISPAIGITASLSVRSWPLRQRLLRRAPSALSAAIPWPCVLYRLPCRRLFPALD